MIYLTQPRILSLSNSRYYDKYFLEKSFRYLVSRFVTSILFLYYSKSCIGLVYSQLFFLKTKYYNYRNAYINIKIRRTRPRWQMPPHQNNNRIYNLRKFNSKKHQNYVNFLANSDDSLQN